MSTSSRANRFFHGSKQSVARRLGFKAESGKGDNVIYYPLNKISCNNCEKDKCDCLLRDVTLKDQQLEVGGCIRCKEMDYKDCSLVASYNQEGENGNVIGSIRSYATRSHASQLTETPRISPEPGPPRANSSKSSISEKLFESQPKTQPSIFNPILSTDSDDGEDGKKSGDGEGEDKAKGGEELVGEDLTGKELTNKELTGEELAGKGLIGKATDDQVSGEDKSGDDSKRTTSKRSAGKRKKGKRSGDRKSSNKSTGEKPSAGKSNIGGVAEGSGEGSAGARGSALGGPGPGDLEIPPVVIDLEERRQVQDRAPRLTDPLVKTIYETSLKPHWKDHRTLPDFSTRLDHGLNALKMHYIIWMVDSNERYLSTIFNYRLWRYIKWFGYGWHHRILPKYFWDEPEDVRRSAALFLCDYDNTPEAKAASVESILYETEAFRTMLKNKQEYEELAKENDKKA